MSKLYRIYVSYMHDVIFYVYILCLCLYLCSDGQDGGIYAEGFLIFTVLVCCMQYKVAMMTCSPTYINWILWVLSFIGYFFFSWAYGMFPTVEDWYYITNFSMGLVSFS